MTQCPLRSALNHRSVGHRISKRNAEFDYRRASRGQFNNQIERSLQIGIAGGDEGNESATVVAFQLGKGFSDSTQKQIYHRKHREFLSSLLRDTYVPPLHILSSAP